MANRPCAARFAKALPVAALLLGAALNACGGSNKAAKAPMPKVAGVAGRYAPHAPKRHCYKRLVVSGAVSLGAFEAGWLYAYGRYRRAEGCGPFEAVAGASAGASNALLAAIDSTDGVLATGAAAQTMALADMKGEF